MKLQELVSLYFERTNAMQTLWSFYITIVLALLAFYASKDISPKTGLSVLITLAFIGFAIVNLDALKDVTSTRNKTRELILNYPCEKGDCASEELRHALPKMITPPSVGSVVVFHLLGDLMVVGGIWAIAFSKRP